MTGEELTKPIDNLIDIGEDDGTAAEMIQSLKNIEEEAIARKSEIITGTEIYQFSSFKNASHRAKKWITKTIDSMIKKDINYATGQDNLIPFPNFVQSMPLLNTLAPIVEDIGTEFNTGQSNLVPFLVTVQQTDELDGESKGNAKTYRTSASRTSKDDPR